MILKPHDYLVLRVKAADSLRDDLTDGYISEPRLRALVLKALGSGAVVSRELPTPQGPSRHVLVWLGKECKRYELVLVWGTDHEGIPLPSPDGKGRMVFLTGVFATDRPKSVRRWRKARGLERGRGRNGV